MDSELRLYPACAVPVLQLSPIRPDAPSPLPSCHLLSPPSPPVTHCHLPPCHPCHLLPSLSPTVTSLPPCNPPSPPPFLSPTVTSFLPCHPLSPPSLPVPTVTSSLPVTHCLLMPFITSASPVHGQAEHSGSHSDHLLPPLLCWSQHCLSHSQGGLCPQLPVRKRMLFCMSLMLHPCS